MGVYNLIISYPELSYRYSSLANFFLLMEFLNKLLIHIPFTLSLNVFSSSSSSTFFAALSCMSVVEETVMVDSEGAEGDIWRGQGLIVAVVHEDSEDISGLVLMTRLLTSAKHVKTKSRNCLWSCWKSIL